MQQRMRLEFSRADEAKFASHLDLIRAWHRAMRRASIPLAYSEGYTPHPRISLAAPLPVGVTSAAEMMDVYLSRRMSSLTFVKGLSAQCPPGLSVLAAEEVPLSLPSLQSLVRSAEYEVTCPTAVSTGAVRNSIQAFLDAETFPWEHRRDTGVRQYDLRPLVFNLTLEEWTPEGFKVSMHLRLDTQGAGRPDQVIAALGFGEEYTSIHRTRIHLSED